MDYPVKGGVSILNDKGYEAETSVEVLGGRVPVRDDERERCISSIEQPVDGGLQHEAAHALSFVLGPRHHEDDEGRLGGHVPADQTGGADEFAFPNQQRSFRKEASVVSGKGLGDLRLGVREGLPVVIDRPAIGGVERDDRS